MRIQQDLEPFVQMVVEPVVLHACVVRSDGLKLGAGIREERFDHAVGRVRCIETGVRGDLLIVSEVLHENGGTFRPGFQQFDRALAFVEQGMAQRLDEEVGADGPPHARIVQERPDGMYLKSFAYFARAGGNPPWNTNSY